MTLLREQFEKEDTIQSNDEFYWPIYAEWLEAKVTSHNSASTPCPMLNKCKRGKHPFCYQGVPGCFTE